MSFRRRRRRFDIHDPFDIMRYFDEIFEEIERSFLRDLERMQFSIKEPGQIRRIGPIIYGYSITIGPDGKPIIREFGTVPRKIEGRPIIEREPLVDVAETDDEIIVTAETPGVRKEEIRIEVRDSELEIRAGDKFYKKIDLPAPVDPEGSKATYNNGVLEIKLRKVRRGEGRTIKVE